ncbi:MAG: single-stranded-DNA-specific exonuclease RecJ [Anaerolineae bacterium]|nr:single-stranded-DNA-specific exonuclease RecJ [Anaerolineae bacterium]
MKRWIEPQEIDVPEALAAAVGGHPLVAQTLVRRGIVSADAARAFLDPGLYTPAPPAALPNVAQAAERLERAIRSAETICVWGDFDVDGQTSTTLLFTSLRDLGALVRFHIPTRQQGGHGIHLPALEALIDEGVRLILTCDTGVSAHQAVAYARERGVDVIVTDHHDLPPELPPAFAVVDPKMLPQGHPLRELPGVGVAYKLAEALYERAGRPGEVEQHLDLVALGIVADVAVQTADVRYLLQRGLEALRCTERLGLRVMMEMAELSLDHLTEEHIGYVVGPRLNALGRLADASVGVELLTTRDLTRARILASELEGLNAQRKLLTEQVLQAAEAQIESDPSLLDYNALVLVHPSWSGGVLGIVAGRLAERYNRPAILLNTPAGDLARGSARSVEGCHITEAIAAQSHLLRHFGGHPMAAGLSLDVENVPALRRALSRTVGEMMGQVREAAPIPIDGYLELSELSLDLVEQLERLAPFGLGNMPLTLATTGLSLVSQRAIGRTGEHLLLMVEDECATVQKVLWWQGDVKSLPQGRFDLAYVVRASNYRGLRDVQVEWVDARSVEAPAPPAPLRSPVEVVDYRREPRKRELLAHLQAGGALQVWAEAGDKAVVDGVDRRALAPSEVLVVWTTPPGLDVLRAAMERVDPQRVIVFGVDPGLDTLEPFLRRLAGLIKSALRSGPVSVDVAALAAATAQREVTVRAGIDWLVAHGDVRVLEQAAGTLSLAAGTRNVAADFPQVTARLKALLDETAAYRAYFDRQPTAARW